MKKAIVLLVLLSMVFPLRAQFVGPFDTKIVNNALFRPYDSMSMNRDYPMLVVGKGTHVKVVNRSKIGSGWYRVKLDDGSIGWVSAEAFCEKGTVPTENGTYEVGGGKSRNIFVGKYDKEIDLLVTAKMSSQAYAGLCQSIELLMLPESFRYLPPYTFEERGAYYVSDYDHVKGYTHKELQAMFGEPEGRIDNALVYTQANRRIKVGTASPYNYIHKFNNDKESESRTEFNDLFIVETTVCLKYKRSAEKSCPRCLHNWSVEGENVTEELLGPIAFVTETWTKHDYTEVTKLGDKVIREEDRTYTDLTHKGANFDYENWEPYFRRYEKGDKHALEEYYEKFFK